jgi:flagellar secretion chaperone FliS
MSHYSNSPKLAAYQSVSVHSSVDSADPHRLVLMLMDGVLERLALARGCIERGELSRTAQILHSCITLVTELRGSLNMAAGGALAQNLSDIYEYMMRQIMRASAENNVDCVREVASLLVEIRSAWAAVPLALKAAGAATR